MKSAERRREIVRLLGNTETPVPANVLKEKFGVSRQVIVQDIAILRANGHGVISTNRGYVLNLKTRSSRVFKCRHTFDEMLEEGLLEEVIRLKEMGLQRGMVSMQGLGYKELLAYLDGECTLAEAVEILKRDTRHFAKRQLTWFRRERDAIWANKPDFQYDDAKILAYFQEELRKRQVAGAV